MTWLHAARLAATVLLGAVFSYKTLNAQESPRPAVLAEHVKACVICHGPQGRASPGGYLPRIAGKPVGYLYRQLLAFRDGRRPYEPMRRLLENLSDDYLWQMALHFSLEKAPYPPPESNAISVQETATARKLIEQGRVGVAACADCHGNNLAGQGGEIPGLLGLPKDYLLSQLGAWRLGQRQADAPDCMAKIAKALSTSEIAAVAAWLSSALVPKEYQAQSFTTPASRACEPAPRPIKAEANLAPPVPDPSDAQWQKGRYLATIGNCAACHTRSDGAAFAGGRAIHTPFGTVYSSNLTPHVESGLGAWKLDDFRLAMQQGKARLSGTQKTRWLSPAFPYEHLSGLKEDDIAALWRYLQSLPAQAATVPPSQLPWWAQSQTLLWLWRTMFFKPRVFVEDSGKDAQWNRGAYLYEVVAHCGACHSPRNGLGASRDRQASFVFAQAYEKGQTLAGGAGQNIQAPSLHDPSQGGVQGWSTEDVTQYLRSGQNQHAQAGGPMAQVVRLSTQYLSASDLAALGIYLASFHPPKALAATLVKSAPPGMALEKGEAIYTKHCADCHDKQGYPKLQGNRSLKQPNAEALIRVVLHGAYGSSTKSRPYPLGMPPYLYELQDADVAEVVNYVRYRFAAVWPSVTSAHVAALR